MSEIKLTNNPSSVAAPEATRVTLYAVGDKLYYKDNAGNETGPLGAAVGEYWFVDDGVTTRAPGIILTTGSVEISGSLSQGQNAQALGLFSHAEGENTVADGDYSHAEGLNTVADGDYSHAEGDNTFADGDYTHAEGRSTTAFGIYSHAEGENTLSHGIYSHAEGYFSTGTGGHSHAEGSYTTADGNYSHSEGIYTFALGEGSHSEGIGTIASGTWQHVQGKYNVRNNDFSIFVIGDGVGDLDVDRSDIVRVNSGTVPGEGRVEVTGTLAATQGLSGSLTQLVDGTSYLIAGDGVTISSGSSLNGAVKISSTDWMTITLGHAGVQPGSSNSTYYVGQMYTLAPSTIEPTVTGSFQWISPVTGSIRKVSTAFYSTITGQKLGGITLHKLGSDSRTLYLDEEVDLTGIYETNEVKVLTSSLDIEPNDRISISWNSYASNWGAAVVHSYYTLAIQVTGTQWP